jgi:hypothetical protein
MIEFLKAILPYISGLWTLPWILVGFIVTLLLSRLINEQKIDLTMKKIGLILLFVFIPLLIFRIFLTVDFSTRELEFTIITIFVIFFMYLVAYVYSLRGSTALGLKSKDKRTFIKTVLTNQGRSAAFIGGAMLAHPDPEWKIAAGIYISLVGVALFAIIPYILSHMHKKEPKKGDNIQIKALPWYLKLYPWYLISFVIAALLLHGPANITVDWNSSAGVVFTFFTAITIPAALYYVGAGIHPHDLKINEMKKLFSLKHDKKSDDHWPWVRSIFFLTVIVTPLLIAIFLTLFLVFNLIPKQWFAVIVINSILPITSTNMFLVPYGIDKKVTALSVTWTTVVCVPIAVLLISVFSIYFT